MHGLRGHPLLTWGEDAHQATSTTTSPSLQASFKALARRNDSPSAGPDASDREPFWPRDSLADDLAEARIWTYGYEGDAIDAWLDAIDKIGVS